MCGCRDIKMPDEWGILSVGPTSCKRLTVKSTLFCSAAFGPSHHCPNSSENSTCHGTYLVCHGRHYAVNGISSLELGAGTSRLGQALVNRLRFPRHVIHQQILPQCIWSREVGLASAHLGYF